MCSYRRPHEELVEFQTHEQRTDIYAALDYFFEHYNQGRPFILAGHSQGSVMLRMALCDYFKEHTEYLERMVAAYVVRFSITPDDLKVNPALKFAEGADDTGVIVSWNTEGPGNKNAKSAVVLENAISINPLNWKRDDTYAPASENIGDRLIIMEPGNFEISDVITTFALSELDKLPKLLKYIQPTYPKEMLHKGIEGEVVLRIVIDSDGKVFSLKPERSTNESFENSALLAVKDFIYEPPLKNGKAVRAEFLLPIPFKILK